MAKNTGIGSRVGGNPKPGDRGYKAKSSPGRFKGRRTRWHVVVECGQSVWRRSSWRRHPSCDNVLRFRRLRVRGFAVGPIIFTKY